MNTRIESVTLAGLHVLHVVPENKRFRIPIFFVHGMCSNAAMFRNMMIALAGLGYECYAIDLPGHGESFPGMGIGGLSLDYYKHQIEGALTHLNRTVILAGHSMGGLLAAKIAENNPFVMGYIGITIAPSRFVPMGLDALKRIWKYGLELLFKLEIRLSPEDAKVLLFNTFSGRELEKCLELLQAESGLAGRQLACGRYTARRLHLPGLIIAAEQDKITPNQHVMAVKLVEDPREGKDFRTIGGCHMVMLDESYTQAVDEIDGWLRQKFISRFTEPVSKTEKKHSVAS